jgi:L-rhamnose mutarotase
MQRYALALDLKDDPALISKYEEYHKNVWPEIEQSIRDAGITNMEIYRVGNRLFMIMEVRDDFSFEKKKEMDLSNPTVQKWEALMNTFQQLLPGTPEGEKWRLMENIYKLK